jgi:PAS domain S-box-containing protein
MWFLLATFGIDSAKGLFVAVALRRFIRGPVRFQTVREFAIFCFFAVLLAPAVSAFGGAAARQALGYDYRTAWEQWFMGDAVANLVLTPAILYWLNHSRRDFGITSTNRLLEVCLLAFGLFVTDHLAFSTSTNGMNFSESRFYAPVPLMFWAAMRFGIPGASGAIALTTIFAMDAAIHNAGPFFDLLPAETSSALQDFLALRAAPLYLVAILMQQTRDAEDNLRESEQRFRIMADTAPVMIWMSGTNKLCEFVNQGWLEFTGRTLEQEIGSGWTEDIHPEDVEDCLQVYSSSFDAKQRFEVEYRLRRHDGEYRWVLDRGVPRRGANGDFIGFIGTAIDITDRKLAEEATHELAHTSRLAAVGGLTAMISHELSNPLSAILTNTDAALKLLASPTTTLDEIRSILVDIRREEQRAAETIHHLRSLLRKSEMKFQQVDLNDAVSEVLRLAAGDALRRRVQIHKNCRVSLPAVQGDAVHLQQVILNLVLNGMDAMRANLESERHLFVTTNSTGDGFVEVAVRDAGHGISPENLSRIFESFFTTKPEGMGIGLSIARQIVQLHSGRLWAESSKDGKGTTFRLVVPVDSEACDDLGLLGSTKNTQLPRSKNGDDNDNHEA